MLQPPDVCQGLVSPSSRRAWIEIEKLRSPSECKGVDRNHRVSTVPRMPSVALLAEGVDRNNLMQGLMDGLPTSSSSRRAWIEIQPMNGKTDSEISRPPRGGRG